MVPSLYGILIILAALILNANGMVYLAIISTLFGATAAAYATALGGANITPAVLVQIFVAWRVVRNEGILGFMEPMSFLKPGFWLLLLTLWGMVSAGAFPRLFEGQFMVNSLDRDGAIGLQLIKPVSMNITQAMYSALGLFAFLAMRVTLQRPGALEMVAKAVLWLAGLNVVAAVLNLAQYHLGMPPILAYIKNGNYSMMGGEVAGLMRISGTFSETSAFSQFTLTLLAFTHTLWINKVHTRWAAILSVLNLGFLMVSTSGTAYVGLAICFSIAFAYAIWYFTRHGDVGKYSLYVWVAALGVIAAAAILLFVPAAMTAVTDFFSFVIGKKVTSDSGNIRFAMNARAWDNFADTFGIGTGLGSNRASSFALVLLSNLGWVGILFFGLFIWNVQMGKGREQLPRVEAAVILGARHAVLASLVAACISAVVYDLGVLFYILAATATVPSQAKRLEMAPKSGSEGLLNGSRPNHQVTG